MLNRWCGWLAVTGLLCACSSAPLRTIDDRERAAADLALERGQRLFLHDRLAWVASDIYQEALRRAGVAPPESVVWAIRDELDGAHMVSFIIDLEHGGGYVDAEVYFRPDADPDACLRRGLEDPKLCEGIDIARGVRPVRVKEQRWVEARKAMLSDPRLRVCTSVPPNFTLLPEGERLIGYVLSASNDPQRLIAAGHSRFELSSDGTQVLDFLPLFRRCSVLQAEQSELPAALLVSGTRGLFDESHVFLQLDLQRPVQVRDHRGRLIQIEDGDDGLRWRRLE